MKFKRSSLMTKVIVLLPAVAATVTLVSLQAQLADPGVYGDGEKLKAVSREVAAAAQENQRLEATIEAAGTEEGVKDIARQKLGLAESGEIVFYDIGG